MIVVTKNERGYVLHIPPKREIYTSKRKAAYDRLKGNLQAADLPTALRFLLLAKDLTGKKGDWSR